jgi:hypothetical protein
MPGELVIQHLISLSDDNKAQQQSRVPFAHGTKAERQARREAYTRAPLTHYIPKDHTAKLRENLQCAHRERVAIIVWRVMRPDAWVMIVTTCVGALPGEEHSLSLHHTPSIRTTCSHWVTSCFHRSRFPQQRVRNAPIASCKTIQWMAPIQAY